MDAQFFSPAERLLITIVAWIKESFFLGEELPRPKAARLQLARPDVIWGSGTCVLYFRTSGT